MYQQPQPYAGPSTYNPYYPPPNPPQTTPPSYLPAPPPPSQYAPPPSFPPPGGQWHSGPPMTPEQTYRQPQLHYSSSPGTPTPSTMNNSYQSGRGGPPSPSSPFTTSPSASYSAAFQSHAPRQQPAYMSPALANQFDGLSTASPMLSHPIQVSEDSGNQHVTVHEYGPSEGTQGTQIIVKCHVHFPPTPPPSDTSTSPEGQGGASSGSSSASRGRAMRIVFGGHPVHTKVHLLSGNTPMSMGQICQLSATVPSWSNTGVANSGRSIRVPLYVQALAGGSTVIETVSLGDFTYSSINSKGPVYNNYTPSNPLKRAGESLESHRPSPNQFLHRRVLSNGLKVESPELPQYNQFQPVYASGNQGAENASYPSPYMQQSGSASQPTYSPSSQPSLMRSTQVIAPGIPSSNPYVLAGGNKASLELVGDLNSMAKGWTEDEWMNRRRLVQFWRRQDGTTISAAFRPLPQAEYPQQQQSIIISCIFREDSNACYVTSVDTIYLLEALVGTRFTVEEKNRIRRNLEGFRPRTVAKSKAGSEDFFKVIMGFPNPKPRNIEKNVKVFEWENLGPALKKIIGKYSASYPYTGSALSTPTMGEQTDLPVTTASYPAPQMMSHPIQSQDYSNPVMSSGSAPTLLSHSSSDSSAYGDQNHYAPMHAPQTPQMSGSHSHSHQDPGSVKQSPTDRYGINTTTHTPSMSSSEKYVNLSPTNDSPYAPTTMPSHSHSRAPSGSYWPVNQGLGMGIGVGVGGGQIGVGNGGGGQGSQDQAALPSPAISSGSYATLPGPSMGYPDQPHQLPHVHETVSKQPSSSDLRVMYTGMAQ